MPSLTTSPTETFFKLEDVHELARALDHRVPVVKGRVWSADDKNQGWMVECESFAAFHDFVRGVSNKIEFLAFDQSHLDEEALFLTQDDLSSYAEEEGLSHELVHKAISALRGHEGELFAVFAYAFLESGHVVFVRAQNELAPYLFHPRRLLSSDGLSSVRKLRTLAKH